MRFGHFFYPMTLDTGDDGQAIDDCVYEAELVEHLGLDAIWLAEHHFIGEVAYGDPMVFAGVVAARTKRVDIGFAIIEMALHHPVRVAVQTALLDHLTRGRLIVGTGRGSNFNAFEYTGFGSTLDAGPEMLNEAEDLLLKAWTTENVDFKGNYWQVAFPQYAHVLTRNPIHGWPEPASTRIRFWRWPASDAPSSSATAPPRRLPTPWLSTATRCSNRGSTRSRWSTPWTKSGFGVNAT